jgi:hypothetical protein
VLKEAHLIEPFLKERDGDAFDYGQGYAACLSTGLDGTDFSGLGELTDGSFISRVYRSGAISSLLAADDATRSGILSNSSRIWVSSGNMAALVNVILRLAKKTKQPATRFSWRKLAM